MPHLEGNPQGGWMHLRGELLHELEARPGNARLRHEWNHLPGPIRRFGGGEARAYLESILPDRFSVDQAMRIYESGFDWAPDAPAAGHVSEKEYS